MTDRLVSRYSRNPDYQAEHDGEYWLIRDYAGWGVAFDQWVFRIWSAFDGSPTDQVIHKLSTEQGISVAVLESTVKALARAGILVPSEPLQPLQPAQTVGLSTLESFPLVSVIVLAGPTSRDHIETCLPSILAQTYQNLEIIFVDNQTQDGSVEFTRDHYPQAQILHTQKALGFDAANNFAMAQAQGEFFFLLNDDTELEPSCVAECLSVALGSEQIACVVPKMKLFYLRSFINSIGNSLYPNGLLCDNFVGYLDVGQFDHVEQVFSACFGAALLRRSVVEEIGCMDEHYSFYLEDMDWSYRAQIFGYQIVAAPRAVVYHKFNATMATLSSTFKLGLIARNRLRFIWKNLNFGRALRLTRIYLAESIRHTGWALSRKNYEIPSTYRKSWGQWLASVPRLIATRRLIRGHRRPGFSDDAAFSLASSVPHPTMHHRYPIISEAVVRNHYMQLAILEPASPIMPEEPIQCAPIPPIDAASLVEKTGRILREDGVIALAREIGRYLYWRVTLVQKR